MNLNPINYSNDVPEIVALLRTSLSDNHTTENFMWKHYDNPFGKSYGLLARDKDKIVGARMFMFWEFRKANRVLRAIRPVDTITHPEYRGKGIFKKLTLQGLEDCKGEYDFVFNTPNTNSFPGYIKMGWNKYDRDLYFKIALTINLKRKGSIKLLEQKEFDLQNIDLSSPYFRTNFSSNYLRWRYLDDVYKVAKFEKDSIQLLLFYKLEKVKGVKTLIIQDILGDYQMHKSAVMALAAYIKVYVVFYLNTPLLNLNFYISKKRHNSIVVIKGDKEKIPASLSFSAGDLEGRL